MDTTGSFSGNGNMVGVTNPGLGSPANNGGPTQTMALLPGSPAINAGSVALAVDQNGNPLTTDQRGAGYPRIVNGTVDIGAFEGPDPTTTALTTSVTPSVYGESVTFTATVAPTPPLSGTAVTPTGTVTFYNGTTALGTGTLNGLGVASYTTTAFQLTQGTTSRSRLSTAATLISTPALRACCLRRSPRTIRRPRQVYRRALRTSGRL